MSSSAFSTSKCTLLPARWSALDQVPLIVVVFKTPVRAECNWDTLQFLNLSSCMPCVQPVTRELSLSLTLPVLPLLSSCVWQHEVQWLSQIMCPFPQTVWCVFPQKLRCVCLVCVCVCMRVCVFSWVWILEACDCRLVDNVWMIRCRQVWNLFCEWTKPCTCRKLNQIYVLLIYYTSTVSVTVSACYEFWQNPTFTLLQC